MTEYENLLRQARRNSIHPRVSDAINNAQISLQRMFMFGQISLAMLRHETDLLEDPGVVLV